MLLVISKKGLQGSVGSAAQRTLTAQLLCLVSCVFVFVLVRMLGQTHVRTIERQAVDECKLLHTHRTAHADTCTHIHAQTQLISANKMHLRIPDDDSIDGRGQQLSRSRSVGQVGGRAVSVGRMSKMNA